MILAAIVAWWAVWPLIPVLALWQSYGMSYGESLAGLSSWWWHWGWIEAVFIGCMYRWARE